MIAPAIQRSGHLLGQPRGRIPVMLLFTDGESGETADELSRVVTKLPIGCVHVVVFGDRLPDQWRDVPAGSVTALSDLRTPEDFEWVLGRALYRSLSLEGAGPERPPTATGAVRSSLVVNTNNSSEGNVS